jgi:hypothetical protein
MKYGTSPIGRRAAYNFQKRIEKYTVILAITVLVATAIAAVLK